MFGRDMDEQKDDVEEQKNGWLLFKEDKKVSREHFEVEVD